MRNLTKRKKKGEIIAKNEGFCYEISDFSPELLQKILDSKHGTYCFESISADDYTETVSYTHLTLPTMAVV